MLKFKLYYNQTTGIVSTCEYGNDTAKGEFMNKEQRVAEEILELVGGKENIKSMEHCATRLRLVVFDDSIVEKNKKQLEEIDGVSGYFYSSKQHQLILGTGFVNNVYNVINDGNEIASDNKANVYDELTFLQKLSRILGDIFVPIIPAIVAAGLFMGLANTLKYVGILNGEGNLALFIGILTDTAFIFLPALICWSATKKFGGNPVLGIIIGLMLVSPSLPNAWATAGGLGDAQPLLFDFGFTKIGVVGAQGQVLTPLVLGIVAAKLERKLHKIIPSAIDLIVTPFTVILLSVTLGLFVFGPVLYQIEEFIAHGITALFTLPFGIGSGLMGFVNPLIVITGLHHSFGPIEIAMLAESGTNYMNPAISAANVAMAGAALGASFRLASAKQKSMAISSSITALFGITEPALFGVNLRFEKVLLMGMIGGLCGGLAAGIFGVSASGTGITGLPGLLLYLDGNVFGYIVSMLIAFVVAALLAFKFGVYDEK